MASVVVVYHSGYGHTKVVAEAVLRGASSVAGVEAGLISVEELPAADASGNLGGRWSELDAADAIIMGCPTYMGSVSAGFKQFMETSSKRWFNLAWKDKLAAGFTNSGSWSGDKLNTLTDLAIFAAQHAMVWVGLDIMPGANSSQGSIADLNRVGAFLGVMTQANVDQGPDQAPPPQDQQTAERLGARVAEAALRWTK